MCLGGLKVGSGSSPLLRSHVFQEVVTCPCDQDTNTRWRKKGREETGVSLGVEVGAAARGPLAESCMQLPSLESRVAEQMELTRLQRKHN